MDAHSFFDFETPLAIAHRGGLAHWPENTLHAFEQAVALGMPALEMDIHRTKDGVLVVHHDPTAERCSGATGAIADMTLSEFKALDGGYNWTNNDGASYPFRGLGHGFPTLIEMFAAFPDTRMTIDNKPLNPEMALQFARTILDQGMEHRVIVASFHAANLRAVRIAHPEIVTACAEQEVLRFIIAQRLGLSRLFPPHCEVLSVPYRSHGIQVCTRQFIRAAHKRGVQVHVWTVNDADIMRQLLGWGVDGILTDYPERLLEVMGAQDNKN